MLLIFYDFKNSIFNDFCPDSVPTKSGLNFEMAATPNIIFSEENHFLIARLK